MTSPDRCIEVCGDGRHSGFFGCDDGNLLDGDGCTSSCQVEGGWTCLNGTPSTPSICYHKCNHTLNSDAGILGCSDGNQKLGDGCNDGCEVERGWECTGGDGTKGDQCKEICGDGFNQGQY